MMIDAFWQIYYIVSDKQMMTFFLSVIFPFIVPFMKILKPKLVPEDVIKFFTEVTNQTIDTRKESGKVTN